MQAAATLLTDTFKRNKVNFKFENTENIEISGYPNALYHAVINILTNAVDALNNVPVSERNISISISDENENLNIGIFNSGNPIPEDIMGKIFEPYFTTKGKKAQDLVFQFPNRFLKKP